jgi:hypothetical protein
LTRENTKEHILSKIYPEPNSGCWLWEGTILKSGYGQTNWQGKPIYVHRLVFSFFRSEDITNLFLDHLCRNRACANPDHLEPVTNKENCLRGNSTKNKQGICHVCSSLIVPLRMRTRKGRQYTEYGCLPCYKQRKLNWKKKRRKQKKLQKEGVKNDV